MKIVVFETEKWECDILQKICCDHEIVFTEEPLRRGNVHEFKDADIISPFVHSELSGSVLECFETLSFIATLSTGYDHIDMEFCSRNDIPVSNVPVYGDHTVAEHVFALLLSISHRIPEAVNRTRKGDFSQKGLQGFDLQNKTLGVVGTGSIGKRVARIAQGFGLNVIAYDPKPHRAVPRTCGQARSRRPPRQDSVPDDGMASRTVRRTAARRNVLQCRRRSESPPAQSPKSSVARVRMTAPRPEERH